MTDIAANLKLVRDKISNACNRRSAVSCLSEYIRY